MPLLLAEERVGVDLHPLIASKVRRQFLMGEYEAAALLAMREVEIRVRDLTGAGDDQFGTRLVRDAFAVPNEEKKKAAGPLTDKLPVAAEQEATLALFAGAIGVFKNPSSHREVDYDDPTFASEVVMFADLLLRMLDRLAPKVVRESALESIRRLAENPDNVERGG